MKEQKRRKKKEIVVLDKGINTDAVGSGMRLCCRGTFMAAR